MNKQQVSELQQDVEAAIAKHLEGFSSSYSKVEPLKLGGAGVEINFGSGSTSKELLEALIALANKHNTSCDLDTDLQHFHNEERAVQLIYMESLENNGTLEE
jgi:hypothetical protein